VLPVEADAVAPSDGVGSSQATARSDTVRIERAVRIVAVMPLSMAIGVPAAGGGADR
jgi:hypothetical protein